MQRDLQQLHPDDHDAVRRAIISGEDIMVHLPNEETRDASGNRTAGTHPFSGAQYADSHPHGRRAALDRGVVHGHWREIEQYADRSMSSGNPQQIAELQDFLQSNAPVVGEQMTHLLKGLNIAATSKPESIVKMRQEEIESILGRLSTAAAGGDAEAAGQLSVFLRNYATTASDSRLRTQLDQGGARAVKAFVDNSAQLDTINHTANGGRDAPATYRLHLIDGGQAAVLGAADPNVATAIRNLSGSISEDGVIG